MPPLAGKPPFATDEPDSFYETPRQPTRRLRQPAPDDPNKRSSAYDVYDNYLAEGQDKSKLAAPSSQSNRTSGIGNMLLNMDMGDDSDDSDDEDGGRPQPANPPGISVSPSKNAVLAAATGVITQQQQQQRPSPPLSPPSQQRQQQQQRQPSPQPIAAPRPGYAAPIAALNLARPDPVAMPVPTQGGPNMRQLNAGMSPPLRINMPQPQPHSHNPFDASPGPNPFSPMPSPSFAHDRPPMSPSPSIHASTPHPLQPPVTPITPAFIRPAKKAIPPPIAVKFEDGVFAPGPPRAGGPGAGAVGEAIPRKAIMRGEDESTLLPTRGEKGDDFWRRFSMVVKEENKKGPAKESWWLRKTKDGYSSYSRWVWVVGMTLLLLIVGGVAAGVYFTRNNPSNTQPKAFGGSANQAATFSSTGAQTVTGKNGSTSTVLHVSPTNTVQRREVGVPTPVGESEVVVPTAVPVPAPVVSPVLEVVDDVVHKNLSARGSANEHFGDVRRISRVGHGSGRGHLKSRLST